MSSPADPPLTIERYSVSRLPFSEVTAEDLGHFQKLIPGRVITDEGELRAHNIDWLKTVRGNISFSWIKLYSCVIKIFAKSAGN